MAAGKRRRFLPLWMGAAGQQQVTAAPPEAVRRRQQKRHSVAGPRPAVVYCMNEAELVDVALAVLTEVSPHLSRDEDAVSAVPELCQCKEGEGKAPSSSQEEQELQPIPEEAPGSTASMGGGSERGPALPSPPDAGAERTGWDDDALKYVREIFFS